MGEGQAAVFSLLFVLPGFCGGSWGTLGGRLQEEQP